ncbi:MAG: type II toxin-antitoxin system HicB family antitoxin [Rhodocyclaceae bacterium]|nr:type II toxin-antitoxin system HicB family antitoxin [Rhodocyclaceae bacterium]
MRYAIVIEKAGSNFSGYVPDLPGCVATGATVEETENELLSAIQFHLEGLLEDGFAAPASESIVEYVFVPAQSCAPGDAPQAACP